MLATNRLGALYPFPYGDNVNKKILTIEELAQRSAQLRSEGRRVVATNGCFDILHVGHVRYLAAARKLGDLLVVGVNGDDSVRQLKGEGRPVNREQDRAEVLAALESVDYVTIFPEKRATNFLRAAQPAVYTKGGDYTADTLDAQERAVLDKLHTRIEIIPFEKGYSTSDLLTRLGMEEGACAGPGCGPSRTRVKTPPPEDLSAQ